MRGLPERDGRTRRWQVVERGHGGGTVRGSQGAGGDGPPGLKASTARWTPETVLAHRP